MYKLQEWLDNVSAWNLHGATYKDGGFYHYPPFFPLPANCGGYVASVYPNEKMVLPWLFWMAAKEATIIQGSNLHLPEVPEPFKIFHLGKSKYERETPLSYWHFTPKRDTLCYIQEIMRKNPVFNHAVKDLEHSSYYLKPEHEIDTWLEAI